MALFQNECEEIPRWNSDRIHDEVRLLIEKTGCDYMEELMTAVFIAHTKVLTAVRLSKKQQELSITVPKLDHFIHRVFRESARYFWKTPFLFNDGGNVVERQKNVLQIEALATEAITTAVRSLLPVKQILQRYLEGDDEEIEAEADAEVVSTAAAETEEEVVKEEVVPTVAPVITDISSAPAPAPITVPAVVNIATEPSVTFSDYDTVFDDKKGPQMRYSPKEGADDDDELYEAPSDSIEVTGEATSVEDGDIVDLEAPAPAPKAAVPVPAKVIKEAVEEEDYVTLD
jgi:hypothetical protein